MHASSITGDKTRGSRNEKIFLANPAMINDSPNLCCWLPPLIFNPSSHPPTFNRKISRFYSWYCVIFLCNCWLFGFKYITENFKVWKMVFLTGRKSVLVEAMMSLLGGDIRINLYIFKWSSFFLNEIDRFIFKSFFTHDK